MGDLCMNWPKKRALSPITRGGSYAVKKKRPAAQLRTRGRKIGDLIAFFPARLDAVNGVEILFLKSRGR